MCARCTSERTLSVTRDQRAVEHLHRAFDRLPAPFAVARARNGDGADDGDDEQRGRELEGYDGFREELVTHELDGAPIMAGMVGGDFSVQGAGGWGWILSDMKSVLETGKSLSG